MISGGGGVCLVNKLQETYLIIQNGFLVLGTFDHSNLWRSLVGGTRETIESGDNMYAKFIIQMEPTYPT